MARRRPDPEPIADSPAEQDMIVFFEERAAADAPLTAEELSRAAGDAAAATRIAELKAEAAADGGDA